MSDPTIHAFHTFHVQQPKKSVSERSGKPLPHPNPVPQGPEHAESHHIQSEESQKQGLPRPDLAYLGIASYGMLSETHSLLGFALVEKLSPLLGALANLAGIFAGGLKLLLSSFSAASMARAHLQAERDLEAARFNLTGIKTDLAEARQTLKETKKSLETSPKDQKLLEKYAHTQQRIEGLLFEYENTKARCEQALHRSELTHVNFALDTTKTIAGVLFAGSSALRLGSDLVALGANLPAASIASTVGATLGKLSIGLTLAISLNNLTRLGFALQEDKKSLEKIEKQRHQLSDKMVPIFLQPSAGFKQLEFAHLNFQEKQARAKLRLNLISVAVNTAALVGGIAVLAMSLAAVPARRGALGFLSIVAIGFAVGGTIYSIQQKRKLTQELVKANPKGTMNQELEKLINGLNHLEGTSKEEALKWLRNYLEIPTEQHNDFNAHYSGFLQARYGQLL